jgi:hypothetical protein
MEQSIPLLFGFSDFCDARELQRATVDVFNAKAAQTFD